MTKTAARVSAADREIARFCRACGHPARVRILRHLLARNGRGAGEIVEAIGLAQSTVSEHLRLLKVAGLLTIEADGPRVRYHLNKKTTRNVRALLKPR